MRHGFGTFREYHVSMRDVFGIFRDSHARMRDDFGTFRNHHVSIHDDFGTSENTMQACVRISELLQTDLKRVRMLAGFPGGCFNGKTLC